MKRGDQIVSHTATRPSSHAVEPTYDGKVVKVRLEAKESEWEFVQGRKAHAWSFNGQVPGPVIAAAVGDVLEVTLINRLPEPTTIHWHGIRLPAPMDGTEHTQRPVLPGETFVYRFLLPDAGTFWYHPHFDETRQLERGLYGALIVRDGTEPKLDGEHVLVLDDVKLDSNGDITPIGGLVENHDGRQGETLLVNGRSGGSVVMAGGQIESWRIVNASSARYIRLSLSGRPFTLLGTDGGLIGAPISMTELLLTPGDRAHLAVGPFEEGETIAIESLPYDRRVVARNKREHLATVFVGADQSSHATVPKALREIDPLIVGEAVPTREVHLGVRPSLRTGVKFVVNGEAHHRAEPVRANSLQVWDVVNDTLMDHPFHLHGFFFQVLAVNGKQPAFLSWEDTVNIPPRSRVRIAWNADDRVGEWMYHCHILEHHASGMMGHFSIVR
jgi:FtsP/CotA-like multicopper oxidase with cupredoxin domain